MPEKNCLECIMCGQVKGHGAVKVCANVDSTYFLVIVSENDTCEYFDGGENNA